MRKLISVLFGIFLVSCSLADQAVLSESVAIPETGWTMENPIQINAKIKDTSQLYDVYIMLRHNTDYEWINLFLFLKTYYPNQEFSRDTLECFLSDETGRWFGKGSSVKDHTMLFKSNVKFPQEGHYQFEFVQGMRTESLQNIMDLGMKIVPSKTKL